MVLAVIQQLTSIKHGRVSLREYDTVERADNYFAEYRMLFLRRRGNERDIFEIARKLHRRHKKPIT